MRAAYQGQFPVTISGLAVYYGNPIGPSQRYLVNLVRPGREQPQQVTRVPRSAGGVATQTFKYKTFNDFMYILLHGVLHESIKKPLPIFLKLS